MGSITYTKRKKWKYRLEERYSVTTGIVEAGTFNVVAAVSKYITLDDAGLLAISAGYTWDGPSGPTFDTKNFMQGSLAHDALYQLMREGLLDRRHRKAADMLLRKICREDGMSALRVWWVYVGVRLGAEEATRPDILHAGD